MMERSYNITSLLNKYLIKFQDPKYNAILETVESYLEHAHENLNRIDRIIKREDEESYIRYQENLNNESIKEINNKD